MADRTSKTTGIKVISHVGQDPDANRYKRVKEEEERLRSDLRRDSKVKRVKERAGNSRLSSGYLEGGDSDDGEGAISLAAIKNKYKKNKGSRGEKKQAYSSDEEDDSDIEAKKARKLEHAKNALKDSDEDSAGSNRSRSPVRRSRSKSGSRSGSGSRSRSRSSSPGGGGGAKSGSDAGSRKSASGSGSD